MTAVEALNSRLDAVLSRVAVMELASRQLDILRRLAAAEAAAGGGAGAPAAAAAPPAASPAAGLPAAPPSAAAAPPEGAPPAVGEVDRSGSEVQQRLQAELLQKGLVRHRFVRAPPEYYDRPLEFRMGIVGAASVHHLCKSIVMVNTRAHASITDCSDFNYSKYYLVVVQYTARLNAEKLKNFVHGLGGGRFGKKFYNMRLAPNDVSDELTGFEHNGVSPIAIRTRMPIILSHKVAELQPDTFFLGAGEVDLKVGFSARDFIAAYQPFVVDCTYDEDEDTASEASSLT